MLQNQVWESPIQRPWAPDGWRRQRRNGGRGRPLSVFSGPGILAAVMADSHLMYGERKRLAPPWVTPPAKGSVTPGRDTLFPASFPCSTKAQWDRRPFALRNAELLI